MSSIRWIPVPVFSFSNCFYFHLKYVVPNNLDFPIKTTKHDISDCSKGADDDANFKTKM